MKQKLWKPKPSKRVDEESMKLIKKEERALLYATLVALLLGVITVGVIVALARAAIVSTLTF